ncbi:hypothetical protein EXIGLDRAFT_763979 [Exidia glandulosa HHB12029]|uniref:F-box domain-containing protein n=1 Tax=Exidia glandulosa HHB12029 TaxID=1314781 RepID=A0A165LJL9_EXIGL|nr:hypothetical protein EXIGLDRAFT_763979 [Exidia glandulosa HHB12029]
MTPATPERERTAYDSTLCVIMEKGQPPIPPAWSLPNELLVYIFSFIFWSPNVLAMAARVCRRWLPAATQVLYSWLFIDSTDEASKLAQTMWDCPKLRALVRRLDVHVDSESLLGWIGLIPAEPGVHALGLWTRADRCAVASVLYRAPALHTVRELHLNGPRSLSIINVPHRLERLGLDNVGDFTLPALPHLRSLFISSCTHVIIPAISRFDQLRTVELSQLTPAHACEILDKLHAIHALIDTLTLSHLSIHTNPPQSLADSVQLFASTGLRVLRIGLPLAAQLSSFGTVEELHIDTDLFLHRVTSEFRALRTAVAGSGSNLKMVRLQHLDESEYGYVRECVGDMGVRVEVVDVYGRCQEAIFST